MRRSPKTVPAPWIVGKDSANRAQSIKRVWIFYQDAAYLRRFCGKNTKRFHFRQGWPTFLSRPILQTIEMQSSSNADQIPYPLRFLSVCYVKKMPKKPYKF